MADMNEYTGDKGALYDFCVDTDLIDTVALVNPEIEQDPTYIHMVESALTISSRHWL